MDKKHLVIYYIATSNYKQGFKHFQKNLHLFYPELEKTVVILSDGLEEWNAVVDKNNIFYLVIPIQHYCWPIITLFKMKYILDNKIVGADYVCYVNANFQFNPSFDFNKINQFIDLNKFNASRHAWSGFDTKIDLDGFIYDKGINKESKAYIEKPYRYVQAAFFIGKANIVYEMCENVLTMCEEDLKRNIIPNFHDESYLNKWINDNQENNEIIYPPKKLLHPEFDDRYPFALINTFIKDRYVKY